MRDLIAILVSLIVVGLVGCSDTDNVCKSACAKLEQCAQQLGGQAGQCTLDTSKCTGLDRCVAECSMQATCDEIIASVTTDPNNSYARCLQACVGGPPVDGGADAPQLPDSVQQMEGGVDTTTGPDGPISDMGKPTKDGAVHLDGAPVKPSTGCVDDTSEPNNTSATATDLSAAGTGLIPGWEICYPGDVDHYAVTLTAGQQLTFTIKFVHTKGDLELALLDPDGLVVATARSEDDDEQIVHTASKAGIHMVGVFGFGAAKNEYDIQLMK